MMFQSLDLIGCPCFEWTCALDSRNELRPRASLRIDAGYFLVAPLRIDVGSFILARVFLSDKVEVSRANPA